MASYITGIITVYLFCLSHSDHKGPYEYKEKQAQLTTSREEYKTTQVYGYPSRQNSKNIGHLHQCVVTTQEPAIHAKHYAVRSRDRAQHNCNNVVLCNP